MNRRGFLQACLAAATAPYVVTSAGVLMPIKRIELFPWQEYLQQFIDYPITCSFPSRIWIPASMYITASKVLEGYNEL